MKVLFDCHVPSLLAHGGEQIQAVNTVKALREIGVDAGFVNWWDPSQTCDVLHFLGRVGEFYSGFARRKGVRFVMGDLLAAQTNRNWWQRLPHWGLRQLDRVIGGEIGRQYGWTSYRNADAVIALTSVEALFMRRMFAVDPERLHIIPNGVEDEFFPDPKSKIQNPKSPTLLCTGTVTPRKRVLELSKAAVEAQVPIWIVGKPYSETDPYFLEFLKVQRASGGLIRYEGPVEDRGRLAEVYRDARGFVLLSTMESHSLSAIEAAAAGCPLLLSDLPWARASFGDSASYCPVSATQSETARALKRFYEQAPRLPSPPKPLTWREVAVELEKVYRAIL